MEKNENQEFENDELVEDETNDNEDEQDYSDTEENDEESEEQEDDTRERLRIAEEKAARYKAERDRLKNKKESDTKENKVDISSKTLLAAYGYKDSDEQKEFIQASERTGVPVEELLEDDFMTARIEHLRKKREISKAAARPSGKSQSSQRDVDYYIRKGTLPTDKETLAKVQKELARRAKERA